MAKFLEDEGGCAEQCNGVILAEFAAEAAGIDADEVAGVSWVEAGAIREVAPSRPVTELKPRKATSTIKSERAIFEDFLASSAAFL